MSFYTISLVSLALLFTFCQNTTASASAENAAGSGGGNAVALSAKVEGRIIEPENLTMDFHTWLRDVSVQLDGGVYITFPRTDGSFEFPDVLPGSYLLEVVNPSQVFEKVRIDITSNGKLRARSWNILKPAEVKLLNYPLKLKSEGYMPYFQRREEWRITDFLFNPMVLMMVVPLIFVFIMPKLQQDDPEVRQQMQAMMNPSQNLPDMSETLTRMFGGGGPEQRRSERRAVTSSASSSSSGTSPGGASKRSGSNRRN